MSDEYSYPVHVPADLLADPARLRGASFVAFGTCGACASYRPTGTGRRGICAWSTQRLEPDFDYCSAWSPKAAKP
jgi:hypothetical protein